MGGMARDFGVEPKPVTGDQDVRSLLQRSAWFAMIHCGKHWGRSACALDALNLVAKGIRKKLKNVPAENEKHLKPPHLYFQLHSRLQHHVFSSRSESIVFIGDFGPSWDFSKRSWELPNDGFIFQLPEDKKEATQATPC